MPTPRRRTSRTSTSSSTRGPPAPLLKQPSYSYLSTPRFKRGLHLLESRSSGSSGSSCSSYPCFSSCSATATASCCSSSCQSTPTSPPACCRPSLAPQQLVVSRWQTRPWTLHVQSGNLTPSPRVCVAGGTPRAPGPGSRSGTRQTAHSQTAWSRCGAPNTMDYPLKTWP